MWHDEDNNIEYFYDDQEVLECYGDIVFQQLSREELIEVYNNLLATARLVACDLEVNVQMPFYGVRGVMH